ncbi:MAG: PhoH family protein [Candidatus Omnitrophica bacterium]|nr:PhoH family protein [Candidatus Omnitrophota bacterium]MDD5236099.1 PhoH family protein [Candidatus Omnitrophota bacterium]MDD5610545.1 PhoH family protein [Candidatus Omnitrophota bacterium]
MEKIIRLEGKEELQSLFGRYDENLKLIEEAFRVKIISRGEELKISGSAHNVEKAVVLIDKLLEGIRHGQSNIAKQDIHYMIKDFKSKPKQSARPKRIEEAVLNVEGKNIGPKTRGQREYVEAIKDFDIVFSIGPAGTGKTYLAMAMAVEALKSAKVRRIILTRPALEAGESLGYLPGDLEEKISPYLRPLYDALYDMMDTERIEKYLETGIIEVAPLAYMRGRTLNDAFIILDEAQNCTAEQMKMFLTRLGFDSKAVITGDITQSDLPGGKPIGLLQAQEILKNIEGIKFIYFTGEDVVRHELVQKIIEAYQKLNYL